MELIPVEDYSELQKQICEARLQEPPLTYDQICQRFSTDNNKIYHSTITTIIKRSALGFPWIPNDLKGGAYPYLCPADMRYLKELCVNLCTDEEGCIDPCEFLDIARDIKISRINAASQFLIKTECTTLLKNIVTEETLEPSRSWINGALEELQLELKKPVYIDGVRKDACSLQRLVNFYLQYADIIRAVPAQLLFGGDETMLSTTYRGKVLVTSEEPHEMILRKSFEIPHITSMWSRFLLVNRR